MLKKWFVDHGLELGILALLIPTSIAGLGKLWSNSEKLVIIETKFDNQEKRVDAISNQLSNLGVRVAYEAIYNRFTTAVLVTKPFAIGNIWHANVHLIDTIRGRMSIYKAKLASRKDKRFQKLIYGSVYAADVTAVPVRTLEGLAIEIHKPQSSPAYLLKDLSFVSYAKALMLHENVKALGYEEVARRKVPVGMNWNDLIIGIRTGSIKLERN